MKRIVKNIFSLIVLIITILTVVQILKLNVLPNKYLTILLIGESFLFLLGLLLYNLKNKFLMVLGIILFIISIIGNIAGYYYLSKMNQYIDKNFKVETYKVTTHYYLITSSNNPINSIDEFDKSKTIKYNNNSIGIKAALKKMSGYNLKEIEYGDYTFYTYKTIANYNGYSILPSDEYKFIVGSSNELSEDMFKVIYEFDVEEEYEINNEIKDTFNVYITGYDYSGKRRDYNLIASVNLKTHKIVLTSIPRDYYIDIPAYNAKDSLTALGTVSSSVPKEALEELFDIKIDYTVDLYTESLVKVVDAIGGVEFCADYDFYTRHDTTLGSYADKGEKVYVEKGCHTYNGLQTLAIARERVNVQGGERTRQENCRKILKSIIKKLASTSSIMNYSKILDSFDGLYTTNINKHMISSISKKVIDNPNFEIIEQQVDGVDGHARNHWNDGDIYTLDPDMNTVNNASKKIKEVLNENKKES